LRDIIELTVRKLIDGNQRYSIPMYQRNYAWEEGEIAQLIQDILDSAQDTRTRGTPYYIGILVVFERGKQRDTVFETIDGQQRLTTLSLLVAYLRRQFPALGQWPLESCIAFEHRENSRITFDAIFSDDFTDDPLELFHGKDVNINTAILSGYRIIAKVFPRQLKESGLDIKDFIAHLLDHVTIMRVQVPEDTDLNHYFEVMNNRGEQLDKHEVLKARLLKALTPSPDSPEAVRDRLCLHRIWEACANTEKYIQLGFSPAERDALFGKDNWSAFFATTFAGLRDVIAPLPVGENTATSPGGTSRPLSQLLTCPPDGGNANKLGEDSSERFNSVANFPNFLLHVLRVWTGKDIPLDDKRLIRTFEENLLVPNADAQQVRSFIFALMKCKYLFDTYIIKREYLKGADGWSLKTYIRSSGAENRGYYRNSFGTDDDGDTEQRPLLMLQAALHVSTPTQVYKHWLNGALYWLYKQDEPIRQANFLAYLESMAKAFVFDRHLTCSPSPADYYEIIYNRQGRVQSTADSFSDGLPAEKLSYHGIENNLVFNFLDYALWKRHRGTGMDRNGRIGQFDFTFRSSIEHYYPQHPEEGFTPLPEEPLNNFGNLCLISHSKNSRLSNRMPTAKKEYYEANPLDSIKQYLMMQKSPWDQIAIHDHGEEMKEVLLDSIRSQDQK